jgi:ATP-dependent Clp protease adaptor protein ClpS
MSHFHADRPPVPNRAEASKPARPLDKPPCRQVPRYKVILHSDPSSDLMFVVRSVMELTRFPRAEATHKMWEAHHQGRSVLLTTWLERAELYVEQFASRGLTTSVEPA